LADPACCLGSDEAFCSRIFEWNLYCRGLSQPPIVDLHPKLIHLIATIAKLIGPGGARAVIAESLLVKHQLIILD
jgi:hypothetical protein